MPPRSFLKGRVLKITQSFTVAKPLGQVWALFQDVATVAGCMPGAELLADNGNGAYVGRVGIKLGPFTASFEGEAQHTVDPPNHSGHLEGRGIDKRGGSRSKLVLDYRLAEVAGGTKVDIDADVQLVGPIAQFGRTGIVNETTNVLIRQFAGNVEARLTALPSGSAAISESAKRPASDGNRIGAFRLLGAVIASFFRRLFGRPT
jgi:carbon monoxide dehydrogenase subunit G